MLGQPKIIETSFRVRYAETDAAGITYHASYIVWFEVGRGEYMWQQGGNYAEMEAQGFSLPVTEVTARYLAPSRYSDIVTVRTWVEELKSRQVTFGYAVLAEDGRTLCTGRSVHVCTDHDGRVRVFPAWVRELLG